MVRNRLNNPRARHLFSGSVQTAQTPISDSGSGQAGPVSCHCLDFQVLTCGRRWNPSSSRPGAGLEAGLARQVGREGAHAPPLAARQTAPVERGTCTEELLRRKPSWDRFWKEGVELIFGDGLTKKRTEDVADARQSPWGNGKSFLKELLGLLLYLSISRDVRAPLKCDVWWKYVTESTSLWKISKNNEWEVCMNFRSKRVQHSIIVLD